LACCVLAVGACGTPDEEAKPRPLPDETRKLDPGTYRTEEFEPAFSFRVGEGWSTAQPEVYDVLLIAHGNEGGSWASRTSRGRISSSPPTRARPSCTSCPRTWPAGSKGTRTWRPEGPIR
jgi:hypothetical protein